MIICFYLIRMILYWLQIEINVADIVNKRAHVYIKCEIVCGLWKRSCYINFFSYAIGFSLCKMQWSDVSEDTMIF